MITWKDFRYISILRTSFNRASFAGKKELLVSTGNYSTNAVVSFVLLEALFCFVP